MGGPPSGHTLYSSPSDLPPLPGASCAASTSIGTAPSRWGVPAAPSSAAGALRRRSRSRSFSLRARLLFLSSEPSSSSSACLLRHAAYKPFLRVVDAVWSMTATDQK